MGIVFGGLLLAQALSGASGTALALADHTATVSLTDGQGDTPVDTASTPPAQDAAPAVDGAADDSAKFKQLNELRLKGWVTQTPSYDETLTRDVGGWRSTLAKAGIGVSLFSINLMEYDLAQAGSGRTGTQLYNGQKFTYQTGNQNAILTYDLSHLSSALEGGQLSAILGVMTNGYSSRDGIRGFRMRELAWYQPILHGLVDLHMGIITNQTEFMGTTVGGDLAGGALGPLASIPVEAGLSYSQYGAPTVSARVHWGEHFYTRTGVQRSISPLGSSTEHEINDTGFRFSLPRAGALVIQEAGYRVNPAPGVKSFWLRGDFSYNFSDYTSYVTKGYAHNYFGFAAVDKQFTQPDAARPGNGVYAGLTYTAAPGAVDLINRYYEARVYVRGPFAGRPGDMVSLVAAVNGYGEPGRLANEKAGFSPYTNSQSYTGSYKFQLTHGLYIQPGISVIVHPVYTTNVGTVVNGLINIAAFL